MDKTAIRSGSIAALFAGIAYILGFAFMALYFSPVSESQDEIIQFFLSKKLGYQLWIIFIYVLFGVALVFLNNALKEIIGQQDDAKSRLIFSFGLIWSVLVITSGFIGILGIETVSNTFNTDAESAKILWSTFDTLQNAMGGGVELIGGVWVFLISLAGRKYRIFHRYLHILGVVISIAGIITLIPHLKAAGALFGLLQIPWFLWLGLEMWQNAKSQSKS